MRLTIAKKLNILISFGLISSVISIIWVATDLSTSDLEGLLKKSALDSAVLLAGRLNIEFQGITQRAVLLGEASLEDFTFPEDRIRFIKKGIEKSPHFLSLALYRKSFSPVTRSQVQKTSDKITQHWRVVSSDSKNRKWTKRDFEELDHSFPFDFESAMKGSVRISSVTLDKSFPCFRMLIPFIKEKDETYSEFLGLELTSEVISTLLENTTEFLGILTDRDGKVLASTLPSIFPLNKGIKFLSENRFSVANRTPAYFPRQEEYVDGNGIPQIAAIQSVGFSDLLVIAQTPLARAHAATVELFRRAFFLGGAILFSVLMIALRFSNAIIHPLSLLSKAAGSIGSGDFSARIELPGKLHQENPDEIGRMAVTFNRMAEKIGDLMIEAIQKTRMEGELKTTQAFQKSFFPRKPFINSRIEVCGNYISASECAGDWWQYVQLGDQLIVAIGDVTGHGAASALITAVVHGGFSELIFRHFKDHQEPPSIHEILSGLNRIINDSTDSGALMTLVIYSINLKSGVLNIASASHPPPYLFRKIGSDYDPCPIIFPATNILGYVKTLEAHVQEIQLLPGDVILLYTDGLFEQRPKDRAWFKKNRLVSNLKKQLKDQNQKINAQNICDGIIQSALDFFGRENKNNPDDITVVVTRVSDQGFDPG